MKSNIRNIRNKSGENAQMVRVERLDHAPKVRHASKKPLTTLVATIGIAAGAFASAIDLSGLTGDTVLGDGDVVTGTLNAAADFSLPKTTIEVTPPDPAAPAQFFKVEFGE